MNNFKKQIQKELKLHSMEMLFNDIETKYKDNSITFISLKEVVS